ncbi:MAG TPA: TetR/AcrR family transcriptional regulator C-terminal domain-containing protein [Solirubrobacteraceae bacterium]|jgi:AcrR family transcriptional regulator
MAASPIRAPNGRGATRTPLSRQLIVDTAIAMIERDGSSTLSMRRLGTELGFEAMALYHHVANRAELLRAISDRVLEPLQETSMAGGWRVACHRFATALRAIAVARPATFTLIGMQPFDTPASLQPVERLLQTLVGDGFAAVEALGVYRAVAAFARGYALAEATGFTVDAAGARGREHLEALPSEDFAILHGRAEDLIGLDADSGFERGLRALLDGLPAPS